jgi:hypothetical protein
MTSSNLIAIIVNKLRYDVDILDVYNSSGNTKGLLTYTKLATVPSGIDQHVQTIRPISQLQAMRTGTIEALNSHYYQQFPLAILVVSKFNVTNTFLLNRALPQCMEQSFKFIKYAQANPYLPRTLPRP